MMAPRSAQFLGLTGLLLALLAGLSSAQTLRDPTLPPAIFDSPSTVKNASPKPTLLANGMALVVRQGQPYLVLGNRLYRDGQQFGAARIEHLSETEVWWREAGVLHKQFIFPGIERRVAVPASAVACPSELPHSPNSPNLANPLSQLAAKPADGFCHKVQP